MPPSNHKRTRPAPLAEVRAKQLRTQTTPPEQLLWEHLRAGRLDGWKFRRQHAIGPFIADFYCHEAKLVVEIDGLGHLFRQEDDAARDRWMKAHGIHTLRLSGHRTSVDVDESARLVQLALERSSEPSPGLAKPRPPSPAQSGRG